MQGRETITAFGDSTGGLHRADASSSRPVRGQAVDLGAAWTFTDRWRPTLALGWAAGSGAAPGAAVNHNHRRTGLQQNKMRLSGMQRMKRFGELLDPELSNLRITTLSFALRPLANAAAELVWQQCRQAMASPLLANSCLSQAPQGLQRAIGQEFDLLFAWRPDAQRELTLLLARLLPGAAFAADRRDAATSIDWG